MNQQLEKQCFLLQDKIDEARKTLADSRKPKMPKNLKPDEVGEVMQHSEDYLMSFVLPAGSRFLYQGKG